MNHPSSSNLQLQWIDPYLRLRRILIFVQNATLYQLFWFGAILDFMLETVGPHVFLKFPCVGLQGRGGIGGWHDVSFFFYPSLIVSGQSFFLTYKGK